MYLHNFFEHGKMKIVILVLLNHFQLPQLLAIGVCCARFDFNA